MNRKAITLIEVVVTSLILSMVLTGIVSFIVFSTRIYNENVVEVSAQNYVNRIFDQIQNDVRDGAKLEFVSNKHLKIRDIDGTVILCEYKFENGVLKRSEGAGTETNFVSINPIMSNDITSELDCSFLQDINFASLVKLDISLTISKNGEIVGKSNLVCKTGCRNTIII